MLRYACNSLCTVLYYRARFEFLEGTAVVGAPYQGRSQGSSCTLNRMDF
jgi:hypothetical protein